MYHGNVNQYHFMETAGRNDRRFPQQMLASSSQQGSAPQASHPSVPENWN